MPRDMPREDYGGDAPPPARERASAHYDAPPPPHEDRYGPGYSGYTYGAP